MPHRRRPRPSLFLVAALLLFAMLACDSSDSGNSATTSAPPSSQNASETGATPASDDHGAHEIAKAETRNQPQTGASKKSSGKTVSKRAPRGPNERPIPAFGGRTLSGTRLDISSLLGTRLLLIFFNPETKDAPSIASASKQIYAQSAKHNFRMVGIGTGSNRSTLQKFVKEQGLEFPIIDDSSAAIARKLRLRSPSAVLGVDAEGYFFYGVAQLPPEGAEEYIVSSVRKALRLPDPSEASSGRLFDYPLAPAFEGSRLSGGEPFKTANMAGKPYVLIFFLHTCPHCHKALQSLHDSLQKIPEDQRPELIGLSVQNRPSVVRDALASEGLDFFDPIFDKTDTVTEAYGATGGVPVVHLIDSQGRIVRRIQGWNDSRDAGIVRMHLAKLAGARVPLLLDPKGYTGSEACGVCHQVEYATWQFTEHATAFDTLVTHGADRDGECVSCHVVGFEEAGGYTLDKLPAYLEGVGCESCHGRGGPHLSKTFVPTTGYETVCQTCHNPTHSLGFDYADFHPRVSHAAIAAMTPADRETRLIGGVKRDMLPTNAPYVGSDACQTCHAAEFETWKTSPHGHAVETLAKKGKEGDAGCLQCHTTGFGRAGGFPADASVESQPDLARVGCESCHGPGGDHVGDDAKRVGTIVSLGDKCDSCVILQICGGCHDDANDPGFEFKVEERIETQRHGTIESFESRRSGGAAATVPPLGRIEETLAEAFEALGSGDRDRS